MKNQIQQQTEQLSHHPLFERLSDIEKLKHFMEYHVFAVYDFMSLLKSIQRTVTLASIPWKPSPYSTEMVRFINEIVVGEESDLNEDHTPMSHFELYLKAMNEVGANTKAINAFLQTVGPGEYNVSTLPNGVKEFVDFNLRLSLDGQLEEVMGAFLFGREKLVPEMFKTIVNVLNENKLHTPNLMFYLKRHIELDGVEHGPMSEKCLHLICAQDPKKWERAYQSATRSLALRERLWDECLKTMI